MKRLAALILLLSAGAVTAREITATWSGHYLCGQGNTAVNLTIIEGKAPAVTAWFHFEAAADNPGVPTGCYTMEGTFDRATGMVALRPLRWLHRPPFYEMVPLRAEISPDGATLDGLIEHPDCGVIATTRRAGLADPAPCWHREPLLSLR